MSRKDPRSVALRRRIGLHVRELKNGRITPEECEDIIFVDVIGFLEEFEKEMTSRDDSGLRIDDDSFLLH